MTTASGTLRICQLPPRVRLDAHWPLQKVPLRATPHCLAFYAEARLYALLTSRQATAPSAVQAWVQPGLDSLAVSLRSDRLTCVLLPST